MKSLQRIIVCSGGSSPEREVSLRSGQAVLTALERLGYVTDTFDFHTEPLTKLLDFKPDLAFIALHGAYGEDGSFQGLLDILGIPYTGGGVLSSALCMSKTSTKRIFAYENIPTPDFIILNRRDGQDQAAAIEERFTFPLVIKASASGSSIGVYIVRETGELAAVLAEAFAYGEEVLVEKYIAGRELTAVVIGNDDIEVLPLIEIRFAHDFYDYDSKYTAGMYEHIVPAPLPPELARQIEELSRRVYRLTQCRSFARVDFMLDEDDKPWVIEINTVPGCTETSLVPDAARAKGLSFDELIGVIVRQELAELLTGGH
jgi:D-alanine-D-alanine ligase